MLDGLVVSVITVVVSQLVVVSLLVVVLVVELQSPLSAKHSVAVRKNTIFEEEKILSSF